MSALDTDSNLNIFIKYSLYKVKAAIYPSKS